jgi:hypothetical protein
MAIDLLNAKEGQAISMPLVNRTVGLATMLSVSGLVACTPPIGVPEGAALARPWLFGIEQMREDPGPQLPLTNRFLANLSAMPNVQVIYEGNERNSFLFSAWTGDKVLVSPWLHGGGNCMNITYTIFRSGQQQTILGLVIAPMPAGVEPDSACVDRAASEFYQAMVVEGM